MTKLERDTRLVGSAGNFRSRLHPDWQVWSPNGGYMAAILLRAIGESTSFAQPLSFSCHFLSVPRIDDVDIQVSTLKRTRNAESVVFQMTQESKPIVHGIAWVGQPVDGYQHNELVMPKVPHYSELKATKDIPGAYSGEGLWANFEQRPVKGDVHWLLKEAEAPQQQDWMRFLSDDLDESPYLSAARFLVLLDTYCWTAAARRHVGDPTYIAPTLSLSVDFHQQLFDHWMLLDSSVPLSEQGYMKAINRLWSEAGDCVASGMATLMCRPRSGH